jgi:GNAT superfamily N-acetyltransferase
MEALQCVFMADPDYCGRVIGHIPGLDEMGGTELPAGKTEDHRYLFGVYLKAEMIGCADLLRGYPDEKTALLGLLLLSEKHHGRGRGAQAYYELEKVAQRWPEISVIRGAVIATNDLVIPFWRKLGFLDTGVRKPYRSGEVISEATVLEKRLT